MIELAIKKDGTLSFSYEATINNSLFHILFETVYELLTSRNSFLNLINTETATRSDR